LRKTGLDDVVIPASTPNEEVWVARFGRLVDKRPHDQIDILYDTLVNTIRGAIKAPAEVVHAKVTEIAATADRQTVKLSNGETISARLVVLATGLNSSLRRSLGIERFERSRSHSVSVGFNMAPVGRPKFGFSALTYFPERAGDLMAYLTLFPIGTTMRANYFVYRDMRDPWLQQMRADPAAALSAALPRLAKLTGGFEVNGAVDIRPVDLYAVAGHRRSGVVLVGDAFATSCPAAGTGVTKVLTDVERLCNIYVPRWLATPGMDERKIVAFYDDPVKRACDEESLSRAYFLRSLSTNEGVLWCARRWIRFAANLGRGALRLALEPRYRRNPSMQPAIGR
jgi:2-polyprenyl-6-methoxyphenol hydroxylase-like FAD-dependent oxidoreductase